MDFPSNHRTGRFSRRQAFGLGAAVTAALALTACGKSESGSTATGTTPASTDPKDIAADAYVFGYPLVLMDVTRETAGPANQFVHATPPTPDAKQVVRLNLDTLYSQAWLDLRAEPMVLQVPRIEAGRYWLMQLLDAWTNTVHNPSSTDPQVKSGAPQTYVITGPNWTGNLPDHVTQLAMPTGTTWLLGRIEYKGGDDLAAVRALQEQLKLSPLSVYLQNPDAGGGPGAQAAGGNPPAQTVATMDATTFMNRLCALMSLNPPAPADADAMKRFATLGITPGASMTTAPADVLTAAATAARKQVMSYRNPKAINENGWSFNPNVGTYGTEYTLRAQVAAVGLGANLPKDAIYPTVTANADGGSRFRLTFPKGQLPPVDAFWSLTAYDAQSYLVQNPAGIYSVGHLIPLTPTADGSVEIVVQNADPGPSVPAGHWLPIPESGQFSLTLRLYAPKSEALEGKWKVPQLEKLS
ncbi:DUF1254 domain-containing protein [Nocardia sp. CDC160]|uniref:DUF1254 domain-containing protein n=1 Tax=Nocardia sp. CDC160 TaxID=3112166 RepID=UPI002DB8CCDA|nr:DUF1254 domain-containing protein [Nocardia sp. CDC160]MEC3920159.1 DUF1254 domain-containing protein [Nocardia sp. CDC160]